VGASVLIRTTGVLPTVPRILSYFILLSAAATLSGGSLFPALDQSQRTRPLDTQFERLGR
jgi:hypothetical protein